MHHLQKLCTYNLWANKRICEYILAAGKEKADKEVVSSFPTIRKTLYHIWDAQVIWLNRLHGTSSSTWPSHQFTGTLQEAVDAFLQNSLEFVNFAEKMNDEDAEKIIQYHATNGDAFQNSIEDILMHIMNHSTFHRGQLITMLRSAGHTAVGSTDYIRFARENK